MRQREHLVGSLAAGTSTARDETTGLQPPVNRATVRFSKLKYPEIKAHMDAAVARGWPRIMVLNRKGAEQRRDRLLDPVIFPTRASFLTATNTPPRSDEGAPMANSAG
jgi:hypothetical protein